MNPITQAIEALPPLPEKSTKTVMIAGHAVHVSGYTAQQMYEYALAALRSMPAEPVAWQVRFFFPEQGDTEWGRWEAIAMENLAVWQRRVKEMPGKYELRPLFATTTTAPSQEAA